MSTTHWMSSTESSRPANNWEAHDDKSLTDAIHECRWAILKDAIQRRGCEAVADFVGTDISSDTYDRVMDETEAQMPDEEFERFWEKYI